MANFQQIFQDEANYYPVLLIVQSAIAQNSLFNQVEAEYQANDYEWSRGRDLAVNPKN